MKLLPFNLIYSGIDLKSLFSEIGSLEELYSFYQKTFSLDNPHYVNTPAYIVDVDDSSFTLYNAFGKEIKHIDGYYKDYEFVEASLDLPLNKETYSDIYEMDIVIVRVNTSLQWLKLFNKDYKYSLFHKLFTERYKYYLNYLLNAKVSPVDGVISSVNINSDNSDLRDVTIKDSNDNEYTITCEAKYLSVAVNDEVKKYGLLETKIDVYIKDGVIHIKDLTQEHSSLINLTTPLFGVIRIES